MVQRVSLESVEKSFPKHILFNEATRLYASWQLIGLEYLIMSRFCEWRVLLAIALLFIANGKLVAKMQVTNLRCEYLGNPLGADEPRPRLSWTLQSKERAQSQSAYRILVAGSRERLDRNQTDLWDTGKVASDQTIHIPYQGRPLQPHQECWWKVRVWNQDDQPTSWSDPACWTMGLLDAKNWRAQWIGLEDPSAPQLDFAGCDWIWSQPAEESISFPKSDVYFRHTFELPTDRAIRRARFLLTADDNFKLYVNGLKTDQSNWQGFDNKYSHCVDLKYRLGPGANTLALAAFNNGPGPAGFLGKLLIEFESGPPLTILTGPRWKVSSQKPNDWQQADFNDAQWDDASVLAKAGDPPWDDVEPKGTRPQSVAYLRKSFNISKPVRRAWIHATALGICELYLNGRRVGDEYFTPGWTDYRQRVYYRTFDVTPLLHQGDNAWGGMVAPGWYSGHLAWKYVEYYGQRNDLSAQLHVEYEDGTKQLFQTDNTWKASTGPIREADFLMGETYDARLEQSGWSLPDFDDAAWSPVSVLAEKPAARLESYPGVPVRKIDEIHPLAVTEPAPGRYVFDLGQNMVGWVRLKVRGRPGASLFIRHAEFLKPDGTLYTVNLRRARATDTYIFKGEDEEIWEPRFTFHGFRYVELAGLDVKPSLDAVTGIVLGSDIPHAGSFECSNPMVNQLFSNIRWGQRGNYLEVPTDCPQRDERLGWTGDAQVFIRTATYLTDVAAFFKKWLVDLEDAQRPDGAYTDVAPHLHHIGSGTAGWGDAGVICPWVLYNVYGDTHFIERHWDAMIRYIDYLKQNSDDLVRPAEGYGDWLSVDAKTPKDVIATAFFAWVSHLMADMGRAIGRIEEAEQYENLSREVKEAFNRAFVDETGRIKGHTQTGYVLALGMDLLPEAMRRAAADHLLDLIRARDGYLSVGFLGINGLNPVLTRIGRTDMAYRLLLNEGFPSWGFEIKNGATTIWERWNSWTPEKGFGAASMNSFNHYAFGSIGQWLFGTVGGIRPDTPSFKRIVIQPIPGGGLTFAKTQYESIRGRIATDWRQDGDTFSLQVEIPPNTTASVYVPATAPDRVTESDKRVDQASGVRFLRMQDGAAIFEVGSGVYEFHSESLRPRPLSHN